MDDQRDYAEEAANARLLDEDREWPEPTSDMPDQGDLMEMLLGEADSEATDGCYVEPDGTCEHGHPSWLITLGMI